jgi:TLC domain
VLRKVPVQRCIQCLDIYHFHSLRMYDQTKTTSAGIPKPVFKRRHGLDTTNLIMLIGVILFTALIVPLLSGSVMLNQFLHESAENNPISSWQPSQPSDLLYGLFVAVFFAGMQYTIETVSYPFFYENCKERNNKSLREKKARKSATVFFKSLFYLGSVIYEYMFFMDAPWFPTFLGGSCPPKDWIPMLFRNNPEVVSDQRYIHEFYLIQIGWRIGDLVLHCLFKHDKQNDHLEMLLHHIVALALVVGSFLANIHPAGALAMVFHDNTDVISSPLRVWGDSVYSKSGLIGPIYVCFLISFFVNRCLALPYLLGSFCFYGIKIGGPDFPHTWWLTPAFVSYLGVLCLLHWYWFNGLIGILTKYVKSGSTEDELNKTQ